MQCEPRLIKPVKENGHKAQRLLGVCVHQSVPSPEEMAATGTAWTEHKNYGCEFHGTEFSNRGWLKQISRKADLMLMLFLTVFGFAGLCH